MTRIGIIGGGNMGEALLKGLLKKGGISRRNLWMTEVRAARQAFLRRRYGVRVLADNRLLARRCTLLILAVKPQEFPRLFEEVGRLPKGKRILSIAAGMRTRRIEGRLGKIPVIRAMPNLAARVGESITALTKGRFARRSHLEEAKKIFESIGEVVVVPEGRLDAITALSGSGPAYVAYLIKILTEAGRDAGLSRELARKLVLQTFLGSSRYLMEEKVDPELFIRSVASKGGTTEAAFSVLKKGNLPQLFRRALRAAARRSKQLSRR